MKTHFSFIEFIGIQKLWIVVRCKELLKLSSPPLQFIFNKKKIEKLQKSETCVFEDVDTLTTINV